MVGALQGRTRAGAGGGGGSSGGARARGRTTGLLDDLPSMLQVPRPPLAADYDAYFPGQTTRLRTAAALAASPGMAASNCDWAIHCGLRACKFSQLRYSRCRPPAAGVGEAGPGEAPDLQPAAAPCLVSGADLLGGDVAQVPLAARAIGTTGLSPRPPWVCLSSGWM